MTRAIKNLNKYNNGKYQVNQLGIDTQIQNIACNSNKSRK